MPAFLAALLVAVAPIAGMSEPQLDAKIASTHALPLPRRINELSRLFLGTPYVEYPLGEGGKGPEPQARWRVDGVDCQTYVETVLAMANARNLSEAKIVLDDIRYDGPPGFETRNHFTEAQWLPANAKKGYLKDAAPALDPKAPAETLVLKKSDWEQVPGLKRLQQANIPEGSFSVRYLPLAEAKQRAARIPDGTVWMTVRAEDPKRVVRISHMGFVVRDGKKLLARHASTGDPKVVIEEPWPDFLARQETYKKWPVVGIALARPLDGAVRVARLPRN